MSQFEFDTEIEDLKTRIEKLEDSFYKNRHVATIASEGAIERHASAGIEMLREPRVWKQEGSVDLPPFLHSLLHLPYRSTFDLAFESKTWTCYPEPLVLYVHWNDPAANPSTEEFYRLHNQTFTITRLADPNTGVITCTVMYYANLKPSGLGKSQFIGNGRGAAGAYYTSVFVLNLKNAVGAVIASLQSLPYSIYCGTGDYSFTQSWNINPGLYDLITSATWQIEGDQNIDRC